MILEIESQNTLAYLATIVNYKCKMFADKTPVVNLIKLFFFVFVSDAQ